MHLPRRVKLTLFHRLPFAREGNQNEFGENYGAGFIIYIKRLPGLKLFRITYWRIILAALEESRTAVAALRRMHCLLNYVRASKSAFTRGRNALLSSVQNAENYVERASGADKMHSIITFNDVPDRLPFRLEALVHKDVFKAKELLPPFIFAVTRRK